MNLIRDDRGAVMMSLLLGVLLTVGIAAGVTVMSSNSFGGEGGFDMSNPFGGPVQAKVYQGKAIADMQAMGKAAMGFILAHGKYPKDLQELLDSGYVDGMSLEDPWGNPYVYKTKNRAFLIASYGSDGKPGPKPPEGWDGTETEPDLIIKDGGWLQVPESDIKLKAVQDTIDAQKSRAERTQRALEKAGAQ